MKVKVRMQDNLIIINRSFAIDKLIEKAIKKDNGFIDINNIKVIRSTGKNSQNHHLNGHIQQICIETGNDFAYLKYLIKAKAIGMGFPYHLNKFGEVVPNSEAKASVEECALLIESCHILANELEIKLKEKEA